jgi:hypothetical protein
MRGFTETERYILQQFKDGTAPFKSVLAKFCELKADEYRRSCTQRMAIVPREIGRAADDAANADVYESFMHELMDGRI